MVPSKLLIFCVISVVCGARALNTSDSNRIVNGRTALRGQFPYQVSLRLADGRHVCSGAILNSRWVITTAFCGVTASQSKMIIFAAAHYRSLDGIPYLIDRIEVHKQFHPERLLNDLSLIRTAYPFVFLSPLIRPIALPRSATTAPDVTVSGWGYVKVFIGFIPESIFGL